MLEIRLTDPNGYTVGVRTVEDSAQEATENQLLTADAVKDAEQWSDFPGYHPSSYRVQTTPLPNDAP
jgi:hypothetical protein